MNYIYCGAHRPILFALALKKQDEQITIISYDEQVIEYCKNENINYIKYDFNILTPRNIFSLFRYKKILDNIISKIDFKEYDKFFILGNRTKAYDAFYLGKELSKIGTVYYKDVTTKPTLYKRPKYRPFFRGDILRLGLKYIMGLDLIYYNINNKPTLGFNSEYLNKYDILEYKPNFSGEEILIESLQKKRKSNNKIKNLIILGDLRNISEYTNDHLRVDSTKQLFRKILDIPIDFSYNKHPDVPDSLPFYDYFKSYDEIPNYKPVEMVFPDVDNSIIAVYSISLLLASKLKHLKAISLLELVEWESEEWKNEMKNWLIKESNNNILFPKSFTELTDILTNNYQNKKISMKV